jgi:hypothetical protein
MQTPDADADCTHLLLSSHSALLLQFLSGSFGQIVTNVMPSRKVLYLLKWYGIRPNLGDGHVCIYCLGKGLWNAAFGLNRCEQKHLYRRLGLIVFGHPWSRLLAPVGGADEGACGFKLKQASLRRCIDRRRVSGQSPVDARASWRGEKWSQA